MKEIFFCPEESQFYSHCLERLVLSNGGHSKSIVEFGSGDGTPVISSLLRTKFDGLIQGFELNPSACKVACSEIDKYNLRNRYVIHNGCFFESPKLPAEYLISNPPYLPAPDDNISLPLLHGGTDGATLTKQLFSLNYDNVLLMISSFSDPKGTINQAKVKGYCTSNFVVSPLKFGCYSSEQKVKNSIAEMRKTKKSFYSSNIYFLAGVLFTRRQEATVDLSTELTQVMTAL